MANTNSPFGFVQYRGGSGASPTFSQTKRRVAAGNATAIFFGDPVMPVIGAANGYITQGAPGTTVSMASSSSANICRSANRGRSGTTTGPDRTPSGDVLAYVVDDPQAQWRVQGNSTTFNITGTVSSWTSSPVGQYAQLRSAPATLATICPAPF